MTRALAPLGLALALALAGCIGADVDPATEVAPAAGEPALSASLPSLARDKFRTDAALPLPEPLATPATTTHAVPIAAGLAWAQIAIDLAPALRGTGGTESASLRVLGPDGGTVLELAPTTETTKAFAWIHAPAPGDYAVEVASKGVWTVGLVTVGLPLDYTPGIFVNISYPEQREIDHSFEPRRVTAQAGEKTRFTTFDYDPHAGIDNLQHNVYFPDLDVRTQGQTTWGEVRTLDFTAPSAPGEYTFYCEYHEKQLRGTLVVV